MNIRNMIGAMFLIGLLLTGCGVSVNGEEVASVDNPLNAEKYINQCSLHFTFTSGVDSQNSSEYWRYLSIDNREDTDAKVWMEHEDGGYVLNGTYVGENVKDYKPINEIYIEMGEEIIITIDCPSPDTNEWEQCGDNEKYKMDY